MRNEFSKLVVVNRVEFERENVQSLIYNKFIKLTNQI